MFTQLMIPAAIVLAGGLIATSVVLRDSSAAAGVTTPHRDGKNPPAAEREEYPHVFGDADAPIKIVEFSDFECPFCARLHPTLKRIVEKFDGLVAWEYRHLPLPSHRNAEAAAYAGECIARLGGNDAFWVFADRALQNQRDFSDSYFESEAIRLGIDKTEFHSCIRHDNIKSVVAADRDTAISHGGRGTPFTVIVYADGTIQQVSGALPYETWVTLLNLDS